MEYRVEMWNNQRSTYSASAYMLRAVRNSTGMHRGSILVVNRCPFSADRRSLSGTVPLQIGCFRCGNGAVFDSDSTVLMLNDLPSEQLLAAAKQLCSETGADAVLAVPAGQEILYTVSPAKQQEELT